MAENIYKCEAWLCQVKKTTKIKLSSNRWYIEITHVEKLSFSRRDMAGIENKLDIFYFCI